MAHSTYVLWLREISIKDIAVVGGKTASLGEMYRSLQPKGIQIPDAFGITAAAYWHYLSFNRLTEFISETFAGHNLDDPQQLREVGHKIRLSMLNARMPEDLSQEIISAYHKLSRGRKHSASVAIRSSATAEDLPDASFAGQQETYLNVHTDELVISTCKRCFASLFTDRAISYRVHHGFNHLDVALSICVQNMVRSDLAAAGVMFSIDTETGFRNAVLINGSYGLGENVVQGAVNPDEFYVFKPALRQGKNAILQKRLGSKETKLVYDTGGSRMVRNIPVPVPDRKRFCLGDEDILTLADWACIIEEHYSAVRDSYTPMDMEWAKDGKTGELYILQARPETVQSQQSQDALTYYELKERGTVILTGRSVGQKIASGPVRVIEHAARLEQLKPGEILVTDKTDPDWEPAMKKAAAILTNRGGRTCHAAIVSRELGLPAIVGCDDATEKLTDGMMVTVSCAEGEVGKVYAGALEFTMTPLDAETMKKRPKTRIMMNLGNPEESFRLSQIPNDGVGLARMEFIVSTYVKVHPMALIKFDELKDSQAKNMIAELTAGYSEKADYFVDTLAQGIAMIAAPFYPKEVILRMSDFKSNEYANLIGGREFEPKEDNPMIGFRGASRYYHDAYRQGFALECRAVRRVREDMGLTNLKVMVPFCRTIAEGEQVLGVLAEHGLVRGQNGLEVYVMVEIPSNVILAREFAEIFDGFSIGSNDLTQLTLGIDRDSEILAPLFDERNEAVKRMVTMVIQAAKECGVKIGICGQAPSDYPEFARFLVEQGIDSMSLTPDAILSTTRMVLDLEKTLV